MTGSGAASGGSFARMNSRSLPALRSDPLGRCPPGPVVRIVNGHCVSGSRSQAAFGSRRRFEPPQPNELPGAPRTRAGRARWGCGRGGTSRRCHRDSPWVGSSSRRERARKAVEGCDGQRPAASPASAPCSRGTLLPTGPGRTRKSTRRWRRGFIESTIAERRVRS